MSIYADHNATTPLSDAAQQDMNKAMEVWGNPSSAHRPGRLANRLLNDARESVAEAAGAAPLEIVFTSGGSEANTLALFGSSWAYGPKTFRLLTSAVEHSSIKDTAKQLQNWGTEVAFAPLEPGTGELKWEAFERQVAEFKPTLISLMAANNETGVLFPVERIAELARKSGIAFHTDAIQAFGKLSSSVWRNVDLVSLSAHKIQGPKGCGALIIRAGKQLIPTHFGGSQEVKRRGGTENLIGVAGFGAACKELPDETAWTEMKRLKDRFEASLLDRLSRISIQGASVPRIPNTSNIRFEGIAAEVLLGALDMDGVSVSAGSACSSGSITPSHVLLGLGFSPDAARECARFSWGKTTTEAEVDTVAELVINHVDRIRSRRML